MLPLLTAVFIVTLFRLKYFFRVAFIMIFSYFTGEKIIAGYHARYYKN
jgi:hypothetical protein